MAAPLVDKRSPAQLVAWVETLAQAERVVPGPDLVGAVVARDVLDPDTIVGTVVPAGARVDGPTAAMVADHHWLVVRDLLVGSKLDHDIANPATGGVVEGGGELDAARAEVVVELARVLGPEVLIGCRLAVPYDEPWAGGEGLPAGTVITGALASEIDRRAWVRVAGWRPRPDGQPDPGKALVGIFGRFASLVADRVNRAPAKHELAFLNLTGLQPLPPRPARVPLTFSLATGSPVDAVVPPGTQVAAAPLEGEEDEVVFETERSLVVTRSRLTAVVVGDPRADTYADRLGPATGTAVTAGAAAPAAAGSAGSAAGAGAAEVWAAFAGEDRVPHEAYLACEPVFSGAGAKDLQIILNTADAWRWTEWPITWSGWVAKEGGPEGSTEGEWRSLPVKARNMVGDECRVDLVGVPELLPRTIAGREACWLKIELEMPLPPAREGLVPDAVAVGSRPPRDLELPFEPFGGPDSGGATAKFSYLSVDDAFAAGGSVLRLRVGLDRPGVGANFSINWSYKAGNEWLPLGTSVTNVDRARAANMFGDTTRGFLRDGEISFRVPISWPREVFYSRPGRWLRAEVVSAGAGYDVPPRLSRLDAAFGWELPRARITCRLARLPGNLPTPAAACGETPVDLSRPFHPLGEEPAFNATFHAAIPDVLARPGNLVGLTVGLANPLGPDVAPAVNMTGKPRLAWEVWDGSAWQPSLYKDNTDNLSVDHAQVNVTLPATLATTTVAGEERYWLRARLVGGNYGGPAAYTPGTDANKNTIYTLREATWGPPVVGSLRWMQHTASNPVPVTGFATHNGFVLADQTDPARTPGGTPLVPFTPSVEVDPALHLGFDQPFDNAPVTLYLQVEPPRPEDVAADQLAEIDPAGLAHLSWEYAVPAGEGGWRPLGAVDETRSLATSGLVGFVGPRDLTRRSLFGQERYWLRARWADGEFRLPPRLRRIVPNTMWATQVTGVTGEILGSTSGDPGQVFTTAQQPVQPGHRLSVREAEVPSAAERAVLAEAEGSGAVDVTLDAAGQPDEVWVRWHAVDDFYASGPRDRHYTLDALSGEARFGDGQHGMVPPAGQGNLRIDYQSGGGEQGNRAVATIVALKAGLPYVDSVTNLEPSSGGAPREPLDRLRDRGPRSLRHRDRAVTDQDVEDLARAASTDVARAVAIAPAFSPTDLWIDRNAAGVSAGPRPIHAEARAGRMGVVIVPDSDGARPTPTLGLLAEVESYLAERCPPTAELWVAGPEWVRVTVTTTVAAVSLEVAGAVGARVNAALERFLHPLTGGTTGRGWDFGRKPHRSDLFALVEGVEGVDHVRSLTVGHVPETADANRQVALRDALRQSLADASGHPPDLEIRRWLGRALVYSGTHQVTVALPAERP